MRVSIITPTLNRVGYLKESVESVVQQGYADLEHIVVDGASTDGTVELLKSLSAQYGNRLRWISQPDRGISEAVNRGFQMASGEILGWIGSDDRLAPDAVARVVGYFSDHHSAQWLYGGYAEIDAGGSFRRFKLAQPYDHKRFVRSGYICGPSVFVRAALARQVGPIREDLKYAMDFDWCLRMAAITHPHCLDAVLSYFRWHPGCITMRMRSAQIDEGQRLSLSYAANWWEGVHIVSFYRLAKGWAWFEHLRWRLKHQGVTGLWQTMPSRLPSSGAAK